MDIVSNHGFEVAVARTKPTLADIRKLQIFVACENIKLFNCQIAATQDEADRGLLTRMLWAEKESLESAMAILRA